MEKVFHQNKIHMIGGGTDNHLMLVDLRPKKLTGKIAQESLDRAGITTNKNLIPFDPEKPLVTSGIRLGTPALSTHPGRDGARLVTTGFAPDLLTASRKAVRHMMALLRARRPLLTEAEAYMVCSLAADLRVSQAVDMPHFSVAAHLPAGVLAD